MTSRTTMCLSALTLIAVLALPGRAAAQHPKNSSYPYVLIDLGTFGGPNAYLDLPGQTTNARGAVIGDADTSAPDPFAPNCVNPDCYISLGFLWQHGTLAKIDSLPGGSSNQPFSINARGLIVGVSYNGVVDPLIGREEARAALWQDGTIRNLGTLPGGTESGAFAVNNRGQVMGPASNAIPDPYGCQIFICWPTQTRGFVWQDGVMQDLGTLGGPDALPLFMNNRGQIAGQSYTSFTPNPATGQPTMDPFLWQNGHMRDLGSLGGTLGFANDMNGHGQVVGQSDLAGDQTSHPFLWDGRALRDLGTLGGTNGGANWINETGAVIGEADLPGSQVHHGFLWQSGVMTDLGTLNGDPCSLADAMNDRGQIVGSSTDCQTRLSAFLWEHGVIADLNTLVAPSDLHVREAHAITDRGEIVGVGVLPNGDSHDVVLIPADLAASEGLTSNAPAPGTTSPTTAQQGRTTRCALEEPWRDRPIRWYPGRTC